MPSAAPEPGLYVFTTRPVISGGRNGYVTSIDGPQSAHQRGGDPGRPYRVDKGPRPLARKFEPNCFCACLCSVASFHASVSWHSSSLDQTPLSLSLLHLHPCKTILLQDLTVFVGSFLCCWRATEHLGSVCVGLELQLWEVFVSGALQYLVEVVLITCGLLVVAAVPVLVRRTNEFFLWRCVASYVM